jgi:CNT family concentrative nucleoside transporter
VGTALGLQVLIGWMVFAVSAGRDALAALSAGVTNAIGAGQEGVDFLFGGLGGMAPNRRSEIARLFAG